MKLIKGKRYFLLVNSITSLYVATFSHVKEYNGFKCYTFKVFDKYTYSQVLWVKRHKIFVETNIYNFKHETLSMPTNITELKEIKNIRCSFVILDSKYMLKQFFRTFFKKRCNDQGEYIAYLNLVKQL